MKFITLTKSDGKAQLINLNQVDRFLEYDGLDGYKTMVIRKKDQWYREIYQEDLTEIENLIKKA